MKFGDRFIKKVKSKIQRNLLDPDQRDIILEKTIKQFNRKLEDYAQGDPDARSDAFALLDELALEYETHHLDILEIYEKAFQGNSEDPKLLRTIVGLLRASDSQDKNAIIYYKALSEKEPDNFYLLSLLVSCYKETQQLYALMMTYERIIEKFRELKQIFENAESEPTPEWESAQTIYENAVLNLAEMYANMGKKDEKVLSIYKEALKGAEINMSVLKILTTYYTQEKRSDEEAREIYEIYLAYEPTDREVQIFLSTGYIESQRHEEGMAILENLFKEDPEDQEVLFLIMDYYLKNQILDDHSIAYYKVYLEKHPDDKDVIIRLSDYYSTQNSLTLEAIEIYKQHLRFLEKTSPERLEINRLLGRYHFTNKNWDKVIEIYEDIQKRDSKAKDFIIPLATAYMEKNQTDQKALKIYQDAVHHGTRNEKIHNILCRYLYATNKKGPTVVKIFKDSLTLFPKNLFARLGMCQYNLFICEYQECLKESLKFTRFFPEDKRGVEYIAKCLAEINTKQSLEQLSDMKEDKKAEILEQAFELNPKSRDIILTLYEIYQKSNRMDEQGEKIYLATLPFKRKDVRLLTLLSQYYLNNSDAHRSFHYDYEIYNLIKDKCPIYNKTGSRKRPVKECPRVCVRMARFILANNVKHKDYTNILRCAYIEGEKTPKLIRCLGSEYLKQKLHNKEALELYEELLKINPENKLAREMVLRDGMKKGESSPVLRYCEDHLKIDPRDEKALDLLIRCLSSGEVFDERIMYFLEKLHHRDPENDKITLALAFLYSVQKNYNITTLGIYLSAIRNRPNDIKLLSGLARCYEQAGNTDLALEIYERIQAIIPDDKTILVSLAHTYMKLEMETPESLIIIKRAADSEPGDQELQMHLAQLSFKKGDIYQGLEIIDRHLEHEPRSLDTVIDYLENMKGSPFWKPELYIKMGYLYIEKECYEEALNQFSYLSSNYGRYCGDLIEGYNRIIHKEPNYLRARIERGVILKILGNYEEAIADLESSYALAGENPNVMYELAECYSAYAAHTRNPTIELLTKLGQLYFDLEEYEKCIEVYQQLLRKDRKSREAILHIGKAFYKKNDLSLALQYFSRLEMSEEVKELLYDLGDDFYTKGDVDKAIEAYNQILAADITYRDVAVKISELREEIIDGSSSRRRRDIIIQQLSQKAQQRFDLMEEVGRGTMGVVFKAYDKELDEIVALKILSEKFSEDQDAQERFRLEVKSARRLSHENVVRIHDLGEEAGRKYISMEYVDGGDLKQLLVAQKRLSLKQVKEFVSQIASALSAAHKLGIIHRDIKPANILLTKDKVCKITDFGIATILKESHNLSPDIIVGTPLYMSPEQSEGKTLGPPSDIYSLGVVMYEMLTGSPPFKFGNIAYHHIFTKPPRMKGIDKEVESIVMKSLEKKPSKRFQDMDKIRTLLETLDLKA